MNPPNKKSPGAKGIPQPFKQRPGPAHQFKPPVAQLKNAVSAQSVKRPVAPPVFRPQAASKSAQPKMANGVVNRKPLVAPSVYRPQRVPKVLQAKISLSQNSQADKERRHPLAPPVYRPEAKKIVQPKIISQVRESHTAPPVYRPEQKRTAQPKMASATSEHRPPNAHPRHPAPLNHVNLQRSPPAQMKSRVIASAANNRLHDDAGAGAVGIRNRGVKMEGDRIGIRPAPHKLPAQAGTAKPLPAVTARRTAFSIQRAEKVPNLWSSDKTAPLLITKEQDEQMQEQEQEQEVVSEYQLHLMGISALGQMDLSSGPMPGSIDSNAIAKMFQLDKYELFALEAYGSPLKDQPNYKYYMGKSLTWGPYENGWTALTSAMKKLPSFGSLNLDLPLFRVERKESKLFETLRKFAFMNKTVYIIHGIKTMQFGQKHLLSTSLMVSSHSAKNESYRRGFYCYKSHTARYMNNFSAQGMLDGGEALLLPGIVTEFTGIKKRKWQGEWIDCAELVEVNKGQLVKGFPSIDDFTCHDVTEWAEGEGYYKGCFLTTACVASRGLPDDCEELSVLRQFRDSYVQDTRDGRRLIDRYYQIAPLIVAAITQQPDAQAVFDEIYDVIRNCVTAVKTQRRDEALQLYSSMVNNLEEEYLDRMTQRPSSRSSKWSFFPVSSVSSSGCHEPTD